MTISYFLASLIGEVLIIVFVVFIFALIIGIKTRCPSCGNRFYHNERLICPHCHYEYGEELNKAGKSQDVEPFIDEKGNLHE